MNPNDNNWQVAGKTMMSAGCLIMLLPIIFGIVLIVLALVSGGNQTVFNILFFAVMMGIALWIGDAVDKSRARKKKGSV